MRKGVRALSWVTGCLGVSATIGLYGYSSHAKGLEEKQIKEMQ